VKPNGSGGETGAGSKMQAGNVRYGRGSRSQDGRSQPGSERPHREPNFYRNEVRARTRATIRCRVTAVPTVTGPVTMTIPKGSDAGRQLRLRGKGIQKKNPGDEIVTLKVLIGHGSDPELAAFLEKWAPQQPFDPRQGMPRA